jgi:hypothetical protein
MFPPEGSPPESEAATGGSVTPMNPDLAALYAQIEAEMGDFSPEDEEDTDPGCSCEEGSFEPLRSLGPASGTMLLGSRRHPSAFPTLSPPDEAPETQPGGFLADESPTDEFPPVTEATHPLSMFRTLRSPPPLAGEMDAAFEGVFEEESIFRPVVSWPAGALREERGDEDGRGDDLPGDGREAGQGEVKSTIHRGLVLRPGQRSVAGWGPTLR